MSEKILTLGDKWDVDGDQYEDEQGKLFGFEEAPPLTVAQKLAASLAESEMIRQRFEAEWDEEKHPRDERGRWTDGASGGARGASEQHRLLGAPSSAFPPARTWTQVQNPETKTTTTSKVTGVTKTITEPQRPGLTGPTRTVRADTLNQYVRADVGRVVGGKVQTPDGSWRPISSKDLTPEVQQLFREIIAKELEGRTPVDKPTAHILGGGPAAGKSTVANLFGIGEKDAQANNFVTINADTLRAQLPWAREAYEKSTGPVSVAEFHEMASLLSNDLMRAAAEGHYNLVLDGTGDSSIEKLTNRLNIFRAQGYTVNGVYVSVPTPVAEQRALHRALTSDSHDRRLVPLDVLREAHMGVSRVLPVAVSNGLFDKFTLHDTRGKSPVLVAAGHGRHIEVRHHDYWDSFVNKGKHQFGVENEPLDCDGLYSLIASILTGEPLPWASQADIEKATAAINDARERGFEIDIPHEIAGTVA